MVLPLSSLLLVTSLSVETVGHKAFHKVLLTLALTIFITQGLSGRARIQCQAWLTECPGTEAPMLWKGNMIKHQNSGRVLSSPLFFNLRNFFQNISIGMVPEGAGWVMFYVSPLVPVKQCRWIEITQGIGVLGLAIVLWPLWSCCGSFSPQGLSFSICKQVHQSLLLLQGRAETQFRSISCPACARCQWGERHVWEMPAPPQPGSWSFSIGGRKGQCWWALS